MKTFLSFSVIACAVGLSGCSATHVLAPTSGHLGPAKIVTAAFDYHSTFEIQGQAKEVYYNGYQHEFDAGRTVEADWTCRFGNSIWDESGLPTGGGCTISNVKVVRGTDEEEKKKSADKEEADLRRQLFAQGYVEVTVSSQESDESQAQAMHRNAKSCGYSWYGLKFGHEYHDFGIVCDGKFIVTR